MRLSPKEVDFSKGFTPELDIFRLKPLGDGLTNVLTKVEHPVVLALNGTWGSGKSTFLRMWASEANADAGSLSVVYYDAFEEYKTAQERCREAAVQFQRAFGEQANLLI